MDDDDAEDEDGTTCNGFKTKANEIEKHHQKLIDAFAALVTSFSKWVKDKEGQLTEEIKKIDEDLVALKEKLTALNASATAIGLATGVALGVIGLLMTAFPPWTSVLLVAGLITAGVGFGTTAGLIIAAGLVQNEITEKENKKQKLEDQIEEIRRGRESLETVGQASLLSFNQCLAVISASQKATIEDAEDIKLWLENGAPREVHRDAGVRSYKSMGSYLDRYAKGITRYLAQGRKK
ncbi:hypothetical protein ASPWEDRAFT_175757 [Aspergillus wentii DTO 134E9]|uniref:Uncharacterized protein n=1 Tax=Aspergillus wentii DTO 134E9 TaxID=1073089 RepID=A0A1L9RC25_ASPWE|nr:uncharacterized protein ASPWEDRAFT_175757 [Aspergillus wentii DTO 134E9]OJJ32479.1 hypothetical protein ASPWEDRAFT_175757 [Aspergillus wentii DTO 134E9]